MTKSEGDSRFSDSSEGTWRIVSGDKELAIELLHLSCSDRDQLIELCWELRCDGGNVHLRERVPQRLSTEVDSPDRIVRLLEVTGLGPGQRLLPPNAVAEKWTLLTEGGESIDAISEDGTYSLVLP